MRPTLQSCDATTSVLSQEMARYCPDFALLSPPACLIGTAKWAMPNLHVVQLVGDTDSPLDRVPAALPSFPRCSMRRPGQHRHRPTRRDGARLVGFQRVEKQPKQAQRRTSAQAQGAESRKRFAFCSVRIFSCGEGKKKVLFTSSVLHLSCRFSLLLHKLDSYRLLICKTLITL